jgi:hypothetical protein
MTDNSRFTAQIAAFVEKAQGNIDLVVRKVALEMFTRVILKSPTDTGRFRGNWQVAIGSIPSGTLALDDKAGTATIAKVQAEVLKLEAGQVIYLTNSLPYATRLEYGWSNQAPNGMVRLTIMEWNQVVSGASDVYAGIGPWQPK